ncbi:serine/threonine-protein kinase haspin-like [Octopus sinensis]|uniref:Serine/threonine-protein kinase haspin-like n=1 Tax=Octopus sinensis TaxID=2607531 RepID=A0A7E6EII5_9MOLL|nr:serine/threonine-protein kinase haspin-like [Octopus sinensis]
MVTPSGRYRLHGQAQRVPVLSGIQLLCFGSQKEQIIFNSKIKSINSLDLYEGLDDGSESENCVSKSNDCIPEIVEKSDSGFESFQEQYEVLVQLALSLAIAESAFEFEHRDLHIANVLISREEGVWGDLKLNSSDLTWFISDHSIKTTIIDYTLSRITFDGLAVFCDLGNEEDIFLGSEDVLQFEVYRRMKLINGY